jgi:hypothetical protein
VAFSRAHWWRGARPIVRKLFCIAAADRSADYADFVAFSTMGSLLCMINPRDNERWKLDAVEKRGTGG